MVWPQVSPRLVWPKAERARIKESKERDLQLQVIILEHLPVTSYISMPPTIDQEAKRTMDLQAINLIDQYIINILDQQVINIVSWHAIDIID